MPELVLTQPCFTISFEPDNSQLRIIWKGLVTAEELNTGYEEALECLKNNPVKQIMIDISKRELQMNGNPNAFFSQIFTRTLEIIKDTVFLAMVLTQEEYFLSTTAARFEHLHEIPNNYVIVDQFLSQADAQAWLDSIS
jgi:hypothetical protein